MATNTVSGKPPNKTDEPSEKQAANGKPERPDEAAFKKAEAEAIKAHAAAEEKLKAIQNKVDNATPSNKDSPAEQRRTELRARLTDIRQKQSGFKNSRQALQDKLKAIEDKQKAKIEERKQAKAKSPFKSVQDIDYKIDELQKQVDTGTMRLVDEKKALSEISSLNRQKKGFGNFDDMEKQIQQLKGDHADIKKQMDNPEAKALSDEYSKIQEELDQIKAEQDSTYKNLSSLRDERSKLRTQEREKYGALKKLRDEHYQGKRAHREYEQEAWRHRKEKQKKEREEYEAGKRRKDAQQRLEDASTPAFGDEINTAEGLIRYFDPSSVTAKEKAGPGEFAASVQRTVDDSGFKGIRVTKKDEEDYFIGGAGKKKKGKKGGKVEGSAPGTPVEGAKFNLNIGIIEDLAKVGIDPPSTQSEVPAVVEKLKEKLGKWKSEQDGKTKENIAKAQKEIDRLEAEAQKANDDAADGRSRDDAKKPAQANAGVNGTVSADAELQQEKDAVADVAEELKEAKLEDAAAA